MLLYIIYIEPLLLYLERNLSGVSVAGIPQVVEAFCDDINVVTSELDDLVKTDEAIRKFEAMSGAILSRNFKCKVLGIGRWKAKKNWPIDFIRTENEIKIFGILFKDSYQSMIKVNWDVRFGKFSNCIKSWIGRFLPSLSSRIEVIKVFALSRVYYVGSILPLTKVMLRKFESVIGKFIWSTGGWVLRVALDEIKNANS